MLNDNFYRGSGVTLVIQRILSMPGFRDMDVYLAGSETLNGRKSVQENTGMVATGHYRHFALMKSGPQLLPALYRFGRWVRETGIDVIHSHHRRLAVLAHLIRPWTRVPVLYTGHLTFPDASWFRQLAPPIVTGVSPSVVEYLKRCTKASEVILIYNPVDFGVPRETVRGPRPLRAVSVGRLDPEKGYDMLIDAWSKLKQQGFDAQLDIFGEGSLRSSLEKQITERNLVGKVRLCGFVSDLSERLPSYAFNVLVSQKEGFPNAVVEAAAHAIPTLLTNVAGSRDTLPPNLSLPNGLAYGDGDALSKALSQWFHSPEMVSSDGKRFYDYLKSFCSPDVVEQRYLNAYHRVLVKTGTRR